MQIFRAHIFQLIARIIWEDGSIYFFNLVKASKEQKESLLIPAGAYSGLFIMNSFIPDSFDEFGDF